MSQLGVFKGIVRDALGFFNSNPPVDPTQVFNRANMPRLPLVDLACLTTQVMVSVPIYLQAGDTVTNLTFISGATAAGTPTNYWFALYSSAATPALLAQTADQTTTAWGANTAKTIALAAPVKIATSGIYYAAIMVKATTVPTLIGAIGALPVLTGEKNIAQSSGSALVATAPATIATPAVQAAAPFALAN